MSKQPETRPGDSAFATPDHHVPHDAVEYLRMEGDPGLTKREYIATAMMAGLIKTDTSLNNDELARDAVYAADALIARLNSYQPPA